MIKTIYIDHLEHKGEDDFPYEISFDTEKKIISIHDLSRRQVYLSNTWVDSEEFFKKIEELKS